MTHPQVRRIDVDSKRRALRLDKVVCAIADRYRWDDLRHPVSPNFAGYSDMPGDDRQFMEGLAGAAEQYLTLGELEDALAQRTIPDELMSQLTPVPKGIRGVLVRDFSYRRFMQGIERYDAS